MITLGVDLAAADAKTGVARIEWSNNAAVVTDLRVGASDQDLIDAIESSDKAGIDCPLGWPLKFIEFITTHQMGHVVVDPVALAEEWRRELAYRATDLWVKSRAKGIQGLSVSTDRIGVTTMRCSALLSLLAGRGAPVDRAGSGRVVEVYPAASLNVWGMRYKRYKGPKGAGGREELVDSLGDRHWLELGEFEQLCRTSDDALDAVIAALTARAAAIEAVYAIPAHLSEIAPAEGWIALPSSDMDLLPTAP